VVHGIVQTHEGTVTVESAVGRGTTFTLYFPASSAGERVSVEVDSPLASGGNLHVLYVDDEEALILMAKRLLRLAGYRVTGHCNSVQALADFRGRPSEFDAVVTDLSMPGVSGAELVREVLRARPDIPIIMTTGYIRPEDAELARELGVGEIVLKPVLMSDLTSALRQRLSALRRAQRSAG
jgi:CheY-like chemotaxis protein